MIIEKRFSRTFMRHEYRDDRFPDKWCTADDLLHLIEQREKAEEKKAGTLPEGEGASWYVTYTATSIDGRPNHGAVSIFLEHDLLPDWACIEDFKKHICQWQENQNNPLHIKTVIITGFFRMRNVPAQKEEPSDV